MSKRRTHSPEFKAKVAMEVISGRKTIQEIAADHGINLLYEAHLTVRSIQVSQWKKQLLESASELFTRGKKTEAKAESQAKEAELFQQIGKLHMELEWLKKISAAVIPVNFVSLSIQTTLSSASAASARFWVCLDPPITIGPLQSGNRFWAPWPGSMRFTWRIPVALAAGWWTTWPEKAFRSAEIEYETSCGGGVYGRFTRSHVPQCPVIHLSVIHVLWTSIKSGESIRYGQQIFPTSRHRKGFYTWWRSWICSSGTFSAGSCQIVLTLSSA